MQITNNIKSLLLLLVLLLVGVGECVAENYLFSSNLKTGKVRYNSTEYTAGTSGVTIDCDNPQESDFEVVPVDGYSAAITLDASAKKINVVYTLKPGTYRLKAWFKTGGKFPLYYNESQARLYTSSNAALADNTTLFLIIPTGKIQPNINQPTYYICPVEKGKCLNYDAFGFYDIGENSHHSLLLDNNANVSFGNGDPTDGQFVLATLNGVNTATAIRSSANKKDSGTNFYTYALPANINSTCNAENDYTTRVALEYVSGYNIVYNGSLINTDRKLNSVSLNGHTISLSGALSYYDKTDVEFVVNEGDELLASFSLAQNWVHDYVYIDVDNDGSFDYYEVNKDGTPKIGSNIVAYSCVFYGNQNTGPWYDHKGNAPSANPNSSPKPFTAPSAGVYRMRFKTDWNSLSPYGGSQFKSARGVIVDVTLRVLSKSYTEITSLNEITDPYGNYRLIEDCSASGTILEKFSGRLDGNYHKITGVTSALFGTLNNATVSNLILEDVNITSGDIVGAIANTATGNSRVYNCGVLSGSVNGSTEAGSIVGRIEGNARVVNCYSYANVSGGTVAGIVGNNAGASATKETVFNGTGTLVMNCAHFGRLSGSSVYPVFGGNDINNVSGVNTYNYYIYDAGVTYASPNSAQGTEETAYFNRFDFYRGILNSHRELAAMYIHGTQNVSQKQIENIAHWKYDRNVAEYLSQEPWPNNTTSTLSREIPSTDEAYKGKRVGTVSATFIINGHSETVTLPLTDMNTDRWDYTYGKVVLPFANEFSGWTMPASGNTDYDNIITGWEVTNIAGGTAGTYSNYNLCDPDCTAKDLYENNNYVWAQGGNFVVPKDVTAITFTAHIVRAVYLRDARPDYSYDNNYSSRTDLGSAITGTYNGKTMYNSMADAFAKLEEKTNPADQAIVLVGNYHLNREFPQSTGVTDHQRKAVTIMSIDADNNQEPDYCLYQFNTQGSGRVSMPPIRFDFVVSPGFAMASYTKGGLLAGIGIIHAKGWFETTETATLTMSEFEMRPDYYNQNSPVILNGGEFSRILMTSTNEYGTATDKLLYTKIGGKAYVETLNLGRTSSVPASSVVSLHPLNVSGGEIVNCHLTGSIHNGITSGDVNFYCNGGYIHEFNGAYQEKLNGHMIAKMDHALIDEFYGGGADDAYGDTPQITGDINITCNNSYVKFFCGGPKFGNMASKKTVTVTATGSTFDEYYGASYGGTALTAFEKSHQGTSFSGYENITFAIPWTNYTSERLAYNSARRGIGVNFDLDFFQYAGGGQATGNQSFYVNFASLSLAKTGSVTSTMTNCTFNRHFFGGGCRGLVDGDVTSTLTDCIVKGNAYGGGYTPTATECMVYPETQPTYPVYKGLYGLFTKYVRTSKPDAYRWVQADDGHASGSVDKTNKLLYTSVDMTHMGEVTGNTSLTIKGTNTVIGGNVFGGGAESKVSGNTNVVIGEQP